MEEGVVGPSTAWDCVVCAEAQSAEQMVGADILLNRKEVSSGVCCAHVR
jgi:hypothetical protein